MRKHLHKLAFALFLLAVVINLAIWGAVPDLPQIGEHMTASAHAEAFLASAYMALGAPLDALVGPFHAFGTGLMTAATEPLLERILAEPNLAMDLTLSGSANSALDWIRFVYWATPVLLVIFVLLWATKPKTVSLIRKR